MMFCEVAKNAVQGSNFERAMVRDGDVMLAMELCGENEPVWRVDS